MPTIRCLTPTLCELFGVPVPALSTAEPHGEVMDAARRELGGRPVRRCLVHAVDSFSEKYDPWVTERAIGLMGEDRHELIVAYHQEYDDVMHGTEPYNPRALRGAENSIFAFGELSRVMDERWAGHDRVIVFAPDHGAHRDPETGKGTHGTESPLDMELSHYYGVRRSSISAPR